MTTPLLRAILGDSFIEKVKSSGELISKDLEELVDIESEQYSIKEMDVDALKQALLRFLRAEPQGE